MSDSYRPRLSIEISDEQADALRELIPWGLKNQLFLSIIDDVIRLARKHGSQFLAAIIAQSIRIDDYSTIARGLENDDHK
jgi:hypothetical protein